MKVLFVCAGNTCRSVMAHYYASSKAPAGLSFVSAGLTALPGAPASADTEALLKEKGVPFPGHASSAMSAALAEEAGLILAMTESQARILRTRYPAAADKVHVFKEYAGGAGDVEDPFGGGPDAYKTAFEEIRAGVDAALEKLKKEVK